MTRPGLTVLSGCALAVLPIAAAPAASADVVHDKQSWHHATETQHDFNICGDLATFTFTTTGHTISTDTGTGFHVNGVENGKYTVVFDDPSLGEWDAQFTETFHFNATPGGTVNSEVGNNNIEGNVRIHELMTFTVSPDGVVHVDKTVAVVDGC